MEKNIGYYITKSWFLDHHQIDEWDSFCEFMEEKVKMMIEGEMCYYAHDYEKWLNERKPNAV